MTTSITSSQAASLKQTTIIVYALYLVNLAIPFLGIIGVIIAYVKRNDAPAGPVSHFTYQIHTFWIGLLYAVIVTALCFVLIGFLFIPVWLIWYAARNIIGLIRATENRPIDNPQSWIL